MIKTILFSTFALLFSLLNINAQSVEKHYNKDEKNKAVQGYDVVTYFTDSEPNKGKSQYSVKYQGALYLFKNSTNKELFAKNPNKYAPQYGGWCAYALGSKQKKVEIDPENYKIVDNKLYLFYYSLFNNTKLKWNEDEKNFKTNANKYWAKITSTGK